MESSSIAKPKEFVDRKNDFGEIVDRTKKNVSLTRKLKIAARDKKLFAYLVSEGLDVDGFGARRSHHGYLQIVT